MNIADSVSKFVSSSDYWAWETDADLRFTFVSENIETLTGLSVASFLGATRLDMLKKIAVKDEMWEEHRQDLLNHRAFRSFRYPIRDGDGPVRWMESSGTPNFSESGEFLGYQGIARDMTADYLSTERLEMAGREIRLSEAVFHHIERIAKIGAWKYNLLSGKLDWSDEIYTIYDIEPGTDINLEIALAPYDDDAGAELQGALTHTMKTGEPFDLILPFVTKKKNFRWVRALGEAEIIDGLTHNLFGTFQDITEERNRQNEVRRLAETDPLTGIANRTAFQKEAWCAISDFEQGNGFGALCLIDLDQFKQTNDHFGHAAGDAVLQATSQWLRSLVGSETHVSRLGGDEFALIMRGFDSAEAVETAINEQFRNLVHRIEFQGRPIEIRASVGFVVCSGENRCLEELMANADLALYDAKSRARRKISRYRKRFGTEFARKMELIGEFRAALGRGEIIPYYQPIVGLDNNRVSGFEALARWNHPTKGVLPAGAFFEVFENQELVADIGDAMIKAITADMARWRAANVPFGRIGINVTDANLLDPGFLLSISTLLEKHRLLPKQLIMEVTENTVFKSKQSIMETLAALRAQGILIALDDFGTGFSSMTHLQDTPFDILKIDKEFVQRIVQSKTSRAIVQSLVTLGHSLDYTTVAEGIEKASDAECLREIGCERAQGYFYAKPMAAEEVSPFLESWGPMEQVEYAAAI